MALAVKNPNPVPRNDAGSRMRRFVQSHRRQYALSANASMTNKIGRRIAAACAGLIVIVIRGTPITAMPPPRPPLAIPTIKTASVAVA